MLLLGENVSVDWQTLVSNWLVRSGCLYMMAWGVACGSWDDSVDWAFLEATGYEEVPDDQFVMTTWHDGESLPETILFAIQDAWHPTVSLKDIVIVDIRAESREGEIMEAYSNALDGRA
ncbi:MAG: hypothetical protein KKA37_08130 [Alphaproteobacteria bacterium]|nr:hypothetical protein [Alphaproteobacteria bacterium]MBU2396841.1 hypothetical protein [Alphaproteobacteria bacterium]